MGDQPNIDPELRGTDRLFALVALINQRLEGIDDKLEDLQKSVDGKLSDHEDRLGALEHWRSEQKGSRRTLWAIVLVVPAVVSIAATIVSLRMV